MSYGNRANFILSIATVAAIAIGGMRAYAQGADPNSAPNPYKFEESWAKLPDGRKMGAPIGVEVDRDGKSVWVFDRCGANNCGKSNLAPVMKFDPATRDRFCEGPRRGELSGGQDPEASDNTCFE